MRWLKEREKNKRIKDKWGIMSNTQFQMPNEYEIRHSCLFFGLAASMVLWHRLRAKNIKTINIKQSTIRALWNNTKGLIISKETTLAKRLMHSYIQFLVFHGAGGDAK